MANIARLPLALCCVTALLSATACAVEPPDQITPAAVTGDVPSACQTPGTWFDPATKEPLPFEDLMARLARKDVVLLGESHTNMEHHRWQLHLLAGLKAHRSNLVVGFEMFPRSVQATLDSWAQGGLSEESFLKAARWREVWGFDAALYLPLFHFVRQNRLPMTALNVERGLVSRVGAEGWRAVPADEREGLSDPAPASEAYRKSLAAVFKATLKHSGADGNSAEISEILEREAFQRFVEAQQTWDRAMAEAIAKARSAHAGSQVVGILGSGHVEHGYGVPHQLADLGQGNAAVLLPVEAGPDCEALAPDVADAVFLLEPGQAAQKPAKPRLGIAIEAVQDGVRVLNVLEGSVAETTGLAVGDVIVAAASIPVARTAELIEIVQRQAPGTWLPLDVKRKSENRQLVAKFPVSFE